MAGGIISFESTNGTKLYWSDNGTVFGNLTPVDIAGPPQGYERAIGDARYFRDSNGLFIPNPSGGPVAPVLGVLFLAASGVVENSASGTAVGGILGTAVGSALSLVDNAGNRFALSGGNIVAGTVATDYETATSHTITVRETLASAANGPYRDTVITINVVNVFEEAALSALGLSVTSFTIGTPVSGAILGATPGSTIAANFLPTGFTINSAARTFAYDGTGAGGSPTVGLRETLGQATRTSTIPVLLTEAGSVPALAGFQMGYNMDGMNYYIPGGILNDWGKNVSIDDAGHIYIPPVKGTYDVVVEQASGTIGNFSSGITVTPVDAAAGRYTINIAAYPTNNGEARGVSYTGSKPTRFTVSRPGWTSKISQEFLSGFTGKWLRNLDMGRTNNVQVLGTSVTEPSPTDAFYPEFTTGSIVPYQDQADAIAALKAARPDFVGLWDVLACDLTDAQISARAAYQRDNIPSNVLIALEFGNETFWNYDFSGNIRMMVDAVRKGYYGNATETTQNPPKAIDYFHRFYATYKVDGVDTPVPSPAVPVGGYLVIDNLPGEGPCILRALQNAPQGTSVTDTAYYTKEFSYSDLRAFGRRWHAVRHNQIIEIYRSVFGEARFQAQIVPVIMGQQVSSDFAGDTLTQRTFVTGHFAKIKGMGCSHYINDKGATAVTAAGIGAAFRANIAPTAAQIAGIVSQVAQWGKVFMSYEGMTHPDASNGDYNHPDDHTYRNAWDAFFSSDEGAAFMADWAYAVRTTATGPTCGYVGMGHRPWTLRDNWDDTANKRYVGWNRGLDPAYLPTDYRLKTLAFSEPLQVGVAVSGPILNATIGSTIVCNVPGITVDGPARTFSGTPTAAGTFANALVETLNGIANSPRSTSLAVAAASTPGGYRFFELTIYGLVSHPTEEPLSGTLNEYPSLSEWEMLTDDTPVDSSTATTSGDQYSTGEGLPMMFDGNTGTFATGLPGKTNVWVRDLGPGKAVRPNLVRFTDRLDNPARAPGDFMFRASRGGVTWDVLYRTIEKGTASTPGNAVYYRPNYGGAYANHQFSFVPIYPA